MELIPLMLAIIKYCATNELEDEVVSAFEVLDDFIELVSQRLCSRNDKHSSQSVELKQFLT